VDVLDPLQKSQNQVDPLKLQAKIVARDFYVSVLQEARRWKAL